MVYFILMLAILYLLGLICQGIIQYKLYRNNQSIFAIRQELFKTRQHISALRKIRREIIEQHINGKP